MTPEELTARATAAVATVEPDARSYEWLTRNVARRRTRRRVVLSAATATLAVAAVAVAVPRDSTPPTVSTTPTTSASPTPAPVDERHGDVDGDGVTDEASIVYEMSPAQRWGIEVDLGPGAFVELWGPGPSGHQDIAGVVDVNGDGRAEVIVETRFRTEYIVATLVGRHLEWVHLPDGEPLRLRSADGSPRRGWGCAEEDGRSEGTELYTVEVTANGPRHVGQRTVYSLDVSVAVELSALQDSWSPSIEPVPPAFLPGVVCGTFRP